MKTKLKRITESGRARHSVRAAASQTQTGAHGVTRPTLRPGLVLCSLASVLCLSAFAQGTAFTYQGRLNNGAGPANGSYDVAFTLFNVSSGGLAIAGPFTNAATAVSNGLFTVTLDLGNQFPGADRWLEIAVRTNGGGAFATLAPRQKFTATPYAITAGNLAPGTGLAGTYSGAVTLNNSANQFAGGFTGNGVNVTNVNAAALGGLVTSNFWQLGGNAGTAAGTQFLGTTDNQPVEIKVNGLRALRLEPTPDGPYLTNQINVIAGSPANFVPNGVHAATIAGGGAESDGYFPYRNSVTADYGTVGGGVMNTSAGGATVAGGFNNSGNGGLSAIGGGDQNWCDGDRGTIGGGSGNLIWVGADTATIGGGDYNTILEGGRFGTIPGGAENSATNFALAAGFRAQAIHPGAFVWADFTPAFFASTGTNQFLIRASGGVGIGKNNPATALDVNGTVTATGFSGSGSGLTGLSAGQLNGTIPGGALAGTYASAVTLNNAANSFTGDGAGLAGVNAATLGGFASASFWKTTGNAGTIPGANFIGTTDNQPLLIRGRFVGVGRTNTVTSAEYFGVDAPVGGGLYGGMYMNTTNAGAKPFYGYAQAGTVTAYHYVDGADSNKWKLYVNGDRLVVTSTGNVGIGTAAPGNLLVVGGSGSPAYCNGTTWVNGSDRNSKEQFAAINPRAVLEKVSLLPITEWKYKVEADGTRHLGPVAQDFHAAFGLNGADDKHIATVDADGVALAAIQGLNQKLNERDAMIEDLEKKLDALQAMVNQLAERK